MPSTRAAPLCSCPHSAAARRSPVREFSTPLSIAIPTTGNLTDDVVANARDAGDTAVFSRRTGDGWVDVTAARVPRRGARRRQGPGRRRRRGRRPGRPAVQDPLRVDPLRLRDLVRRRRDRADLRDLVGRADRLDPPGLRRPRRRRRRARPPGPGPGGARSPATSPSSSTCGRSRTTPSTCSAVSAPTSPTRPSSSVVRPRPRSTSPR